uniref:Alpha N-terminal protein methyltransferase 1 n=1 Tax=Chromera velia CCMP2878 TaxID=1169474 RepID=A0A0G4FQ34_9ALVE|eukprot:Cvel_18202.t1-p1 / transcript=Cvel_18202.t1 / gene=Cvel_18202 / organism=Chromera_velia_CCMP2878 / gene_product=N-terminal Xaa-Pro-Lys N-methyltransferase 1-B, putative / transcript_product=N-terminal Xaa-Pro-Lys N-methyltransferase 1-B, putative / location=Cvel_scaffold1494:12698-18287(-) / protein_length=231 / sequence_SO=supercontig / SO=protein_coding / is_pseudo=false
MWKEELGEKGEKRTEWYKKAEDYWENQEVSVNGVLGGYEVVSHTDIAASSDFLNALKALPAEKGGPCGFEYACDCGAGIGRVSKGLLLKHFQKVDLVEPCEKYLRKAKDFVQSDRAKEFICVGLQDFDPIPDRYDVIWIQWVALYLTDPDLDSFLKRCKRALKPNGVICLKENVVVGVDGKFHIDKDDNSIMRTDEHYRVLIKKAGLQLLCEMRQPKFPKGLFPVFMFAFR